MDAVVGKSVDALQWNEAMKWCMYIGTSSFNTVIAVLFCNISPYTLKEPHNLAQCWLAGSDDVYIYFFVLHQQTNFPTCTLMGKRGLVCNTSRWVYTGCGAPDILFLRHVILTGTGVHEKIFY